MERGRDAIHRVTAVGKRCKGEESLLSIKAEGERRIQFRSNFQFFHGRESRRMGEVFRRAWGPWCNRKNRSIR